MFSDKDLRKLIVPLVIEQILAVLVGTADTVMVSYAGEAAISGVSLVDMFAYMVITILTALATGGAVIVSQYLGNKEQENANRAAGLLMSANRNGINGLLLWYSVSAMNVSQSRK